MMGAWEGKKKQGRKERLENPKKFADFLSSDRAAGDNGMQWTPYSVVR
jgi:hypothetical protein